MDQDFLSPLEHPFGEGLPATLPQAQPLVQSQVWARMERQWASGSDLPWLHREVASRMAERLTVIRNQPDVVLEWDAWAGQSRLVLQQAYPRAVWVPVNEQVHRACSSTPPAELAKPPWREQSGRGRSQRESSWIERMRGLLRAFRASDVRERPAPSGPAAGTARLAHQVPPSHGQLLWCNLGLHTHDRPAEVLRRWHAALSVDGFLMFSTFGPDTLRELRSLWDEAGWGPASQSFRDMHDWGDDLVAAGFADPVMDQETLTLTWVDADAALAELRTLGRNAHPQRHAGCRTPRWKARMKAALQGAAGPDGRIALTFEVIYGHAFRPQPRARMEALSTVSLDDMRRMVQSARPTG